jgi:hypothetical protein
VNRDTSFNLDATQRWVLGALKDPHATAGAFRDSEPGWQHTLIVLTLPLYVGAAVAGFVLSWVFGQPFMFGAMASAPLWFLVSLAWSVAYVFVAALIFDVFAGVFDGRRDFDAAFAALSLAMVPAVLGGVLSPLPWFGWLIGLVAGIYSLVLLYQFIPVFMTVPEAKRVLHFVVSLIVAIVVNMLVAGTLGALFGPDLDDYLSESSVPESSGGLFGDFERQADVAEQASQDTYEPPADGRLSEAQVKTYARTLERTAQLRERLGKQLENLEQEGPSIGDIFSGVQDATRLATAEMEVVKTAGGNWAEHQWVKNQIEIARIQQDSTPAVAHNYELFLEYQEQIERYE